MATRYKYTPPNAPEGVLCPIYSQFIHQTTRSVASRSPKLRKFKKKPSASTRPSPLTAKAKAQTDSAGFSIEFNEKLLPSICNIKNKKKEQGERTTPENNLN
jgi:hypothetical protein